MATPIIMPRQGQSVESCIITTWAKKVGDEVKVGDTLFSYETDKSSFDEVATVAGTLLAVFAEEGDEVPCLQNVCVIGNKGEDTSSFAPGGEAPKAAPAKEEAPAPVKEEAPVATPKVATPTVTTNTEGRVFISPRARSLAEGAGVDYTKATPTGPEGRIIERDIEALLDKGVEEGAPLATAETASAAAPSSDAEYEDIKLSNVRKTISKAMHNSLTNAAQLTINASFDATKIQAYRAGVKANGEAMGLANITLNDIVVFATAKTLVDFKELNSLFLDDKIRTYKDVHMGIACDTDRGLLVPTVRNANKLTLNELSKQAKALINEAKEGHINPDKLSGASFTVTNLGSFGVTSFTPVINLPQVAILGVCGIETKVRAGANGEPVLYPAMGLSLTIDHRAVDGAPAAKFLKTLSKNLENFDQLLAK